MGLRERQKEKRCDQILDAARLLIRSTGGIDFPMRQLAEEAEVSLVTPYNLFGSKSGVLYALLNVALESLPWAEGQPVRNANAQSVVDLAGMAAQLYADDAAFYRPLLRFLLGVRDAEHRPRLVEQSVERWRHAVEAVVRAKDLDERVDIPMFSRQLMITFMGSIELWAQEELTDEGFIAQSIYGSALLVCARATNAARPGLMNQLHELELRLQHTLNFPSEQRKGSDAA
jgi:AcrR family transcriptional regulator